jgi:hypothetical protein
MSAKAAALLTLTVAGTGLAVALAGCGGAATTPPQVGRVAPSHMTA